MFALKESIKDMTYLTMNDDTAAIDKSPLSSKLRRLT